MGCDWENISRALEQGNPVCLYDFPDREAETDVLYIGCRVEASIIDFIRREVGGPLAVYVSGQFLGRARITTFRSLVESGPDGPLRELVKPNRGNDPRFAISLDARENLTGCSPHESARTVQLLYDLVCEAQSLDDRQLIRRFTETFVAPGHVPIIRIADEVLSERQGHAELALAIARLVGVPDFAVAGELVDPRTLGSMSLGRARQFAEEHNMPFIMGEDVVSRWSS